MIVAYSAQSDHLQVLPDLLLDEQHGDSLTASIYCSSVCAVPRYGNDTQAMDPSHRDSLEELDLPDVFDDFTAFVRSMDHHAGSRR